jgi:hypothetical protein
VTSLTGSAIRVLLRAQRVAQRYATIEGTRRMSRWTERLYRLPRDVRRERVLADGFDGEWLTPKAATSRRILFHIHGGGFVLPLYNPDASPTATKEVSGTRRFSNTGLHSSTRSRLRWRLRLAYRWLLGEGACPEDVVFTVSHYGNRW